jgi:hypothetical protein
MAVPNNILQTVQTYQKAELAWLLNSFCAISLANKKFKDFNDKTANLGDTVTFDLPPRYIGFNGLVITTQPSTQRVQSLSATQATNISAAYTDQQFIFNVRDYMDRFGKSAMDELGSIVEGDLLKNAVSGVRISDPNNADYNSLQTNSGPYRFYGDGVTQITSYTQLAQALANFRSFGAAPDVKGILPDLNVPAIVGTGLNQFAMSRNNEIANSWELGNFSRCEWYQSNLLPLHTAGSIGNTAAPNNVMTVVSTNDPTGVNVTQITFTEPTSGTDADAIKSGDLFQFNDGVSGRTNVRFRTFEGHFVTSLPFQFRATADAATTAGSVTVSVFPAIVWATTANQNVNTPIVAGMQVTPLPTHRAGLVYSGNQFYLAMPKLPDQEPYPTVNMMDPESGASIRHYWGTQFGQNNKAYVRDCLWGSTLVPDNCMRLIFPA